MRICTGLVCVRSSRRDPSAFGVEVERVVLLPRRMLGRNVELGEVEIVGLDVRTFGDGEAHVGEDLDALVVDLADGMDAAVGDGAEANRQRDVGALVREPLRQGLAFQRSLARLQRVADARLELVDRLAEALALLRRQRAELLHQLGDAALLAEHGDAHLLDRGEIARAAMARQQLALRGRERSEPDAPRPLRVSLSASAVPGRVPRTRVPLDAQAERAEAVGTPGLLAAAALSRRLLRLLDGGGSLIGQRLETGGVRDGEIGQNLAVDVDPGLVETVDKSAVGQAVLAHGGIDALDPEGAEGALLTLAVAILILQRLLDGLLGDADRVLAAAIVALGGLQNFLVLGMGGNAALYACHGTAPLR